MLVVGDFNARSHLWENTHPTVRGDVLTTWAAALDQRLLNSFDVPTCVKPQGSLVIDLSWVFPATLANIRKWEVASEEESLSDHKYVFLDLGPRCGIQTDRRAAKGFPQWNLKILNGDLLCACVASRLWPRFEENLTAEQLAERIQSVLTEASDIAMRRSSNHHKRPVYWWNSDIAELRNACVRLRRLDTRGRKKQRAAVPPLEAELARARGALRRAIRETKDRAWLGLLADVDGDPWGRAYRIVLGKMRPQSKPVCETLLQAKMSRVMAGLFPLELDKLDERPRLPVLWDEDHAVSVREVEWAASKLKQSGKAPGPDGIWGGVIS
ncbi:PREDICTED: uncharacterized protein LOC105448384 [Wasmannia auropunctata]|uniref:uncharacterized protein LOC105448384 n=1 Tax=Wasmannia auropunctata TaxID=64793 RepID=UPI0005EDB8CB|nr:PREDICTED: uncharacterized protein LOC105448384 [Wasmannia auropunctata]